MLRFISKRTIEKGQQVAVTDPADVGWQGMCTAAERIGRGETAVVDLATDSIWLQATMERRRHRQAIWRSARRIGWIALALVALTIGIFMVILWQAKAATRAEMGL